MVEMMGFEPMTPCLQGRCSPSWATPPYWVCLLSLPFFQSSEWIAPLRDCVSIELFSRTASRKVSSPLQSLTSVFGMGTGGPSAFVTLTILQEILRFLSFPEYWTTFTDFCYRKSFVNFKSIVWNYAIPPFGRLHVLHRKEVIQPHLPIRLPCYDLTPIIEPTFDDCLLAVSPPASGVFNFHGLTGGVYKARERIHRDMLIRDY